ncbi:MFS transporter [Isoptericola sp. b441]|uniref:MFS transporter n=1 Tax=Actinotalea lenta TaxID=3064654 RepID=A0ABT9DES3_9CELL|nr:MFS transporter [Isoptericola sp. b441]MDO8107712.1 MFS transporter [Isoptericola sp. b441]
MTGPTMASRPGTKGAPGARTPVRRLVALSWAHLLNDGAANYLPGVLPAVLVAVDEPVQMAGVLIAALTIGQALQPLTGWVADRVGGRRMVAAGLLLSSLGGGLLGVTRNLALLVVLLLMIGLGSALFHPQALAGVRSILQDRRGLMTSVFLVGGELGRGIWPTAASLVATHLGLTYLWIVAVPGLATVALVVRWAPDLAPRRRTGAALRWREHRRPLTLLLGYRSIRALTTAALVAFIPILWHVRGAGLVTGASVITTIVVAGVAGNLLGGHLADRLGRRPVLVVSSLATAALIFPVVYLHGPVVWVAAAVLGPVLFLTASPSVLIGQDIFPENRSMGSGIALGLANGVGALLVLVIGFLVTDADVMPVFWVVATLSVLSAGVALAFPRSLMH